MVGRQYSKEERVIMVETYFRTRSYLAVINQFREQFPERPPPTKSTGHSNVKKYREHGTSLNRNQYNCGRHRTGRSAENIDVVREVLQENPRLSCRRNGTGLPSATFNRIVRLDLRWFPYRMKRRHQLQPTDFARRTVYSQWFLQQCADPDFISNVVIGDEAAFHLNSKINTRNVIEYAPLGEKPDIHYDVPVSCLLYTSPSPRDKRQSRMPSSA